MAGRADSSTGIADQIDSILQEIAKGSRGLNAAEIGRSGLARVVPPHRDYLRVALPEAVYQTIIECLEQVSPEAQRQATKVALQICDQEAADAGYTHVFDHLVNLNQTKRFAAFYQVSHPGHPEKQAADAVRQQWNLGRLKLARLLTDAQVGWLTAQSAGAAGDEVESTTDESLLDTARRLLAENSSTFFLVEPGPRPLVDWRKVLDGAPLTPAHAAAGATIGRHIGTYAGGRLDRAQFAVRLAEARGRTVLLRGDAGDGKSSFVSWLAVSTSETHVFVESRSLDMWDWIELKSFEENLTLARAELGQVPPTVVFVYGVPALQSEREFEALRRRLQTRPQSERITVLIHGRPGHINLLAPEVTATEVVSLAPLDPSEVIAWRSLIQTAHESLRKGGKSEADLAYWFPNLPSFLGKPPAKQLQVLSDDTEPMVVRLLRAVYGEDSWQALHLELQRLPLPARKAYFHVCVATVSAADIPEELLLSLAPIST